MNRSVAPVNGPVSRRLAWSAIIGALVFPSLVTLVYFVWLADGESTWQQATFSVGKLLQFGFPLIYVIWIAGQPPEWFRPRRRGCGVGFACGTVIVFLMWALYAWVLEPYGWFEIPRQAILAKVQGFGIRSTAAYVGLGVFYALFHSGLEEYYWRWFVFGQLTRVAPLKAAIVISSLGFMAHHVILLAMYFGWASPLTLFFSLSIAIGGALWAWLYHWSGSISGPWVSHLLVDAGIFGVGFLIVKSLFVTS